MECIVEYDYTATHADELSMKKGDVITNVVPFEAGWKKGWLNGKEGVFPDNFVKVLKSDMKNTNVGNNNLIANFENSSISKNQPHFNGLSSKLLKDQISEDKLQVMAIFDYQAENADEINLEVGEIIRVLSKNISDEGWWKGIKKTGETGIFPSNFVQPVSEKNSFVSLTMKTPNEKEKSNKIIDNCSFNENSNVSASVSCSEFSISKRLPVTSKLFRPNNVAKSSSLTKNINVSSTSVDSVSDSKSRNSLENLSTGSKFKALKSQHETTKDNVASQDRSKISTKEEISANDDDCFISKSEFLIFKKEVEKNIIKLSIRIQTILEEMDEEKKQRAASEIELVRLRRIVHMLDAQVLNGFNH